MKIRHYTEAAKFKEIDKKIDRLGYSKKLESFIFIEPKTSQLWKAYPDYDAPAGRVDWYILETIDEIPDDMRKIPTLDDMVADGKLEVIGEDQLGKIYGKKKILPKRWWQFWKK